MSVDNHGTWPYRVRIGDVLKTPNGDLRIVRDCSTGKSGYTTAVVLAIRRCSWTGRAYTTIGHHDLKQRGFVPTGKRVKLKSRLDKKLARNLKYENRFKQNMDCCDAKCLP